MLPLPKWLWRVTWHGDKAYGIAYGGDAGEHFSLQTTDDGINFEERTLQGGRDLEAGGAT